MKMKPINVILVFLILCISISTVLSMDQETEATVAPISSLDNVALIGAANKFLPMLPKYTYSGKLHDSSFAFIYL